MSLSLSVIDHLRREIYIRMQKLKEDEFLSKYVERFLARVVCDLESSFVLRQGDLEVDPYSPVIIWDLEIPEVSIGLLLQDKDWNYVVKMQRTWEKAFGKDISIGYVAKEKSTIGEDRERVYIHSLNLGIKEMKGKPIYLWLQHVSRENVKSVEDNAKRVGFNVTETAKILPRIIYGYEKPDWQMLKGLLENFKEKNKISFEI